MKLATPKLGKEISQQKKQQQILKQLLEKKLKTLKVGESINGNDLKFIKLRC